MLKLSQIKLSCYYGINFLPQDTPSLAEALQSGHYHIKWTTCSDLPTPMYSAYVAVCNGTIYCTGYTPNEENRRDVYFYDTRTNQWKQLPRPGHHLGVLHVVENKLTIFGGVDPNTYDDFNKVTTYNSITNSWYSHFPNMLHNRNRPGVVTSHDYVIVMGGLCGTSTDTMAMLDNMEVMNYYHLQWREVSAHLPVPMWAIKPTISGDNIIIVGYSTTTGRSNGYYQIPTEELISSFDQSLSPGAVSVQWKELSAATYWSTATIPYSNFPVIIGGCNHVNQCSAPTSDVSLYDIHKNSWRKVDSLTNARIAIGVSLINSNTIIAIGGNTQGGSLEAAKSSCLTIVEIGTIVPNQ